MSPVYVCRLPPAGGMERAAGLRVKGGPGSSSDALGHGCVATTESALKHTALFTARHCRMVAAGMAVACGLGLAKGRVAEDT